jgi:CHASE2 domain-containing sensor protein/tRNA A-37 threonylcarbamoyl transferase component Bud32
MPLPETETLVAVPPSSTLGRFTRTGDSRLRRRRLSLLGHGLLGFWALGGALLTGSQTDLAHRLERQIQSHFFELRQPVTPPSDIVILALDADTSAQGKSYLREPRELPFFEPLQTSPPQRIAYATAIERLMQAGARSVALDLVLDEPKDAADDQRLQTVLQNYAGRVTLASIYEDSDNRTNPMGDLTQLRSPSSLFETTPQSIGFVNFPIEPNGKIHSFGGEYLKRLQRAYAESSVDPQVAQALQAQMAGQSFAEAVLQAARYPHALPGRDIFFYGPQGTFKQVPFWQVLDPENWVIHQQAGTFRNKIVLIGPTAKLYGDFHAAPFSGTFRHPNLLAGVEIHANAIATLIENRSVSPAILSGILQGGFVLVIVLGAGYLQSLAKRSLMRFGLAIGLTFGVGAIGYGVFVVARLTLPIAVPMIAIALSGVSYIITASAREYMEKKRLRRILEANPNSALVPEIISQFEDFQDILKKREQELFGTTLNDRYKIIKVLGSGGFGETYVAEDLHRPSNPACVVKWLKPASKNSKLLKLAKRLFEREAKTLDQLGKHNQIPELLAYFEEDDEFYLVQEYVPGQPLSAKLGWGKILPEAQIVMLLQELLKILEFVHSQGVIHRDIKPSNIIVRQSDGKPVLIDFGAVKEIHQQTEDAEQTVGIGTKGYMPIEQSAGNPQHCSDIYAVGMIGIQALTGLPPSELLKDAPGRELLWRSRAQHVSHALTDVLTRMVRFQYTERYQTATEALQALQNVSAASTLTLDKLDWAIEPVSHDSTQDSETQTSSSAVAPTKLWDCNSTPNLSEIDLP